MNDNYLCILLCSIIAGAIGFVAFINWNESQTDKEAIRAGLIQKMEGARVIWVKP